MKIITGNYKGQKLKYIKNKLLKPTTSIIKKILFSWLLPFIKNTKCLDCFAGTGALSLEAISNKAKYVTLIEKNYKIFNIIKKNFYKININKYNLLNKNCITFLKKKKITNFDIIFLDPPFYIINLNKIIQIINNYNIININGLIYIETFLYNNIIIPKSWYLYKHKIKHNIKFFLYIKN